MVISKLLTNRWVCATESVSHTCMIYLNFRTICTLQVSHFHQYVVVSCNITTGIRFQSAYSRRSCLQCTKFLSQREKHFRYFVVVMMMITSHNHHHHHNRWFCCRCSCAFAVIMIYYYLIVATDDDDVIFFFEQYKENLNYTNRFWLAYSVSTLRLCTDWLAGWI